MPLIRNYLSGYLRLLAVPTFKIQTLVLTRGSIVAEDNLLRIKELTQQLCDQFLTIVDHSSENQQHKGVVNSDHRLNLVTDRHPTGQASHRLIPRAGEFQSGMVMNRRHTILDRLL